MTESAWDPKESQREFYRHRLTGDLGWLVRRENREAIKYDRPDHDQWVPVRRDNLGAIIDWVAESPPAPLTLHQAAIIAYEADRALDRFLGNVRKSKAWIDMGEDFRRKWVTDGPPEKGGVRRLLFDAIVEALDPFTG